MVAYRSVLVAAWISVALAWVGSASGASLELPAETRPHEFVGTVKMLVGNILTIILDQDDLLPGKLKKGDTINVTFLANTRVRNGDKYLPGAQVFIAAAPVGTAWAALDVRERRPAPVAQERSPAPPGSPPPPSAETLSKMQEMLADAARPRPPCQSCRIQLQSEDRQNAPTITTSRLGNTFYVAFYEYVDATAYDVVIKYECAITFNETSAKLCVNSTTVPKGTKGQVFHSHDITPKGKTPLAMNIKASARLYKKYMNGESEVTDLITSHEQALKLNVNK